VALSPRRRRNELPIESLARFQQDGLLGGSDFDVLAALMAGSPFAA
jgi:hypothetical protein